MADLSSTAPATSTRLADPFSLMQTGLRAFEGYTRAVGELANEVAGFMQARYQEDARAWAKLSAGAPPNELLGFQQQFVQRAMSDYTDEAGKLSRMVMKMAADASHAWNGGSKT